MAESDPVKDQPSEPTLDRVVSASATSENSQTAQQFISQQLQLEADARESMPYKFDSCTYSLGPLKQNVFSCLTCKPPPEDPSEPYDPAGVCYSCSISCHGDHELVECWGRREFVCDCGTTRMPSTSPCSLRFDGNGKQGGLHSEPAAAGNTYNQNFKNRFCGCGNLYDPHTQKGSMLQCIGLATEDDGGCGEDWWHPGCIVGLGENWQQEHSLAAPKTEANGIADTTVKAEDATASITEQQTTVSSTDQTHSNGAVDHNDHIAEGSDVEDDDEPLPPGFPRMSSFDRFICYKCTSVYPWIKRYAGANGFLGGVVFHDKLAKAVEVDNESAVANGSAGLPLRTETNGAASIETSNKRKREDGEADSELPPLKEAKSNSTSNENLARPCLWEKLPEATSTPISLFVKEDFRDNFCRCPSCFPKLSKHPQLLEEEIPYSPPLSEGSDVGDGAGSVGSRSLLERGEAAFSNMDRVTAIEAAMAAGRLRDKLKPFLKGFADSGEAVGAEDIKNFFAKLTGDDKAMREAQEQAAADGGENGDDGDGRREQRGY